MSENDHSLTVKPASALSTKQGQFDKEIEIYRDDSVIESFMSDLRPGESFRFVTDPYDLWYKALTPVRRIGPPPDNDYFASRWIQAPSFVVESLEVVQAPMVNRVVLYVDPVKKHKGPVKKHNGSDDDVIDVEFKDG